MKNIKGISFAICIGKYGGFSIYNGYTKRICLGWVSFVVFPFDLEKYLHKILEENKQLKPTDHANNR